MWFSFRSCKLQFVTLCFLMCLGSQKSYGDISDPELKSVLLTVTGFASDMTMIAPCMYAGMIGPPDMPSMAARFVEGSLADALQKLRDRGASSSQIEVIREAFFASYHPQWDVADVREFIRLCWPLLSEVQQLTGHATPLGGREGFR